MGGAQEQDGGDLKDVKVELKRMEELLQPCKFCKASFSSELELILHFHEEHIISPLQKNKDTPFSEDDDDDEAPLIKSFAFLNDDDLVEESDREGEEEKKELLEEENEEVPFRLDFLTDYEQALLEEPLIPDFEEEEEEVDDAETGEEDDCDAVFSPALEIADCSSYNEREFDCKVVLDKLRLSPAKTSSSAIPIPTSVNKSSPWPSGEETDWVDKKCKLSTETTISPAPPKGKSPPPKDQTVDKTCADSNKTPTPKMTIRKKKKKRGKNLGRATGEGGLRHECIFCGKGYSQYHHLCVHLRMHSQERPFFCRVCDRCFSAEAYLSKHIKAHHPKTTCYNCKTCSESFKTPNQLQDHMRTHSKGRRFGCKHCEMRFFRRDALAKHFMVKHSKRRPFRCHICGKGFKLWEYLRYQHMRLCQAREDKGTLTTSPCKGQTPSPPPRTPKPQAKLKWSDQTVFKGKNEQHQVPPSRPSFFVCPLCSTGFAQMLQLEEHMTSHHWKEKEARFKCKLCNIPFYWKGNLTRHMRLHTTTSTQI